MLKKIYIVIKILIYSKKTFKFPAKKHILILDKMGSNKIKDYVIPTKSFSILPSKYDILNLPIFIFSVLFLYKYGKYTYEICFIKYVNPKIAITFIDNSYFYCDVFESISSCKLFLVQNGRGLDRFSNIKSKLPRYRCDYYFVNSSYFIDYAKKYISTKYVTIGSIIANNYPINKKFKKINKIQWVSHFRSNEGKKNYKNFYIDPCRKSLIEIQDYAINNQLNLEVIGRTVDDEEVQFYKKYINKMNFKFISNDLENQHSISYTSISDDAIIVGIDSQFLYETFGRGYRTAFLSVRGFYINNNAYNFAWPHKTDISGKFWINQPVEGKVFNILDYLSKIEQQDWEKERHLFIGAIKHNYQNTIIKNYIDEVLYK